MTQPINIASARFFVEENREIVWEEDDEKIAQLLHKIYQRADGRRSMRVDYNILSLGTKMSIMHNVNTVYHQENYTFREEFSMMAWGSNWQTTRNGLMEILQHLQSTIDDSRLEAIWLLVCTESLKVLGEIEDTKIARSVKHVSGEKTTSIRHEILGRAFLDKNELYLGKSTTGINARWAITRFGEESKRVKQALSSRRPIDLAHLFFVFWYDSDSGEWKVLFSVNHRDDMSVCASPSRVLVEIKPSKNIALVETANINTQNTNRRHFERALRAATEICGARDINDAVQQLRKYWIQQETNA